MKVYQCCTSDPGHCHRRTHRRYVPGHIPGIHKTYTLRKDSHTLKGTPCFSESREILSWERTLPTCSRSFFTGNNIFIQEFVLWLDTSVSIPFALTFSLYHFESVLHSLLPLCSHQLCPNKRRPHHQSEWTATTRGV